MSAAGAVRLVDVRESALDVEEVRGAVADEQAGGVVVFVGAVRDADGGKGVRGLAYTAHPSAVDALREVAEEVATGEVVAVAVVHRTGELGLGDLALVAAVSAVHRGEAFAACERLVDELKRRVPIWKHQRFTDGTEEWVGSP
ncbi:molybdopterin synthase catalytic subunit [Motilibacter rhizosphaerae]|uniref:Molybdopterin synthase catalytic subunit n=1 Tax=Motilibacter rhizosphaerae TaxID=598652 RepID=A0A4Q7NPF8_9ACTN|nr:molybdenum cofactor biosynthesis protein MoaE [Motilibacter rhizosphaerae]RZS87175.1 molybdopterin synthase catalytic subunit [Motilibacter rhizosphaerae]